MRETMRAQFEILSPLNGQAWQALQSLFAICELSTGEHLPNNAASGSKLIFVCTGLLRYYYTTDDGKEWNKAFVTEHMLTAAFCDDFLAHPSPYIIEALEDSVLMVACYREFTALATQQACVERLGLRFLEQLLAVKLNRERSFLVNNASARYLELLKNQPELCARLTQYHLASYLGISEVSLSRLRNQVRR